MTQQAILKEAIKAIIKAKDEAIIIRQSLEHLKRDLDRQYKALNFSWPDETVKVIKAMESILNKIDAL